MSLAGKVVVVTGGGTGIGLGIAKSFLEAGCKLVITGRRLEKLEHAKSGLSEDSDPQNIEIHTCDVSNRNAVEQLFAKISLRHPFVDVLVNSAGVNIPNRTMQTMTPDQWDQLLAINATGAYNCIYQVLPSMRAKNDGLILNVSSVAGKRALTLGGIAYAASKFAMTALGTAIANEVANESVRVTNLYPGEVNTPILENRPKPVSDEQKSKMVQPEDIGALMVAIAKLPPRAHVPEIILKPTVQEYV